MHTLKKSPVIHKRTIKEKKQIQTGFGVSLSFIDNTSIVWHDRVRDSHWRFEKPSKAIITVEIRLISYQLLSTVYSGCSKVTVTYNLVLHYPQPNNVAHDRLITLSLHHFLSKNSQTLSKTLSKSPLLTSMQDYRTLICHTSEALPSLTNSDTVLLVARGPTWSRKLRLESNSSIRASTNCFTRRSRRTLTK